MIDSVWALGDYAVLAERISGVGELLVERAGVEAGMDVLDVATGTGNAALPAVQRGARVTGLELVPELLDMARERAAESGFEVDWVEGSAEELPFADAEFDRVVSVFGHMFAPHHERAAAELVRVCRPGGVVGFCCWVPEGTIGRGLGPIPTRWGTEEHVRELLPGPLNFERHAVALEDFEQDYLLTIAAR